MLKPALSGDSFLNDVHRRNANSDSFDVWWLGQSGFLIRWQDRHLLMDPYLSDSLTKKYADTDKPHVRMSEQVIDPLKLDFIDVVTSSHSHTDHLDHLTLQPLVQVNPGLDLVVPVAILDVALERSCLTSERLLTINAGQSIESNRFCINAVPSAHELIETDKNGNHLYLGYVVQFGPWTIYHSGDTVQYDKMEEILSQWKIDVMFLPINGRKPERRVSGNLWGKESAQLAKAVNARMAIPHHYNMFEFNSETPDEFIAEAESINQPYHLLRNGERWNSNSLTPETKD
jgi:L-ascorbate metabolism protein UlaG (beta-lactamase superfamily)|tara:strand:- start:4307 stop:5170 length:864 start_codon:yes stop_codon:yes gene_type:complete